MTIERLRADKVREPEQIASFILGTSRLIASSLRRTARRHQQLDAEFGRQSMVSPAPDADRLDQARLQECLRALPERDRAVLVLTFYSACPRLHPSAR